MSRYLDSAEAVIECVARHLHDRLPLHYDEEYVRLAAGLIATLLGRRCVTLVSTTMPLLEPIMHTTADGAAGADLEAVCISQPLMSEYLNQPTSVQRRKLEKASSTFDALADAKNMLLRRNAGGRCRAMLRCDNMGSSNSAFDLQWGEAARSITDCSLERSTREALDDTARARSGGRAPPLLKRFDDHGSVRFQMVLRVVLMVAHWHQHYTRGIPFDSDHRTFRPIELAVEPKWRSSQLVSGSAAADDGSESE